MKKNYWWRVGILFIGGAILSWGYVSVGDYLNNVFLFRYNSYVDPMMFLSLPIIMLSLVLFFVSNDVFLKWFKFAIGWIILFLFFIFITPEYSGGWMSLTPDREQVSIWMSSLFLIISLILITVWQIKERKSLK